MGKRSKGWEEAAEQFKRAIERLSKRGFDVEGADEKGTAKRLFRSYAETLVRAWRKIGFPYHRLSPSHKAKELCALFKYVENNHSKLIFTDDEGNTCIRQTMHGLRLANSYFPHMVAIRAGGKRTPLEVFNDDALLAKALMKRIEWGGFSVRGKSKFRLTANEIKKGLRTVSGAQAVSNFRPSAAAALYYKYLPECGGTVFDPSCGFGGRLCGALACDRVKKYIGCDPASETFKGLLRMQIELLPMTRRYMGGRDMEVELHMLGSETPAIRALLPKGGVDAIFSSPPYFSQEMYSDEPTQSWKKFPNPDQWMNGFIGATLENCEYCLAPGGTLAINIADVKDYEKLSGRKLTDDFVALAESKGWKLVETMKLALSSMVGTTKYRTCPKCIRLTEEKYKVDVTNAYEGSWKRCLKHKYKYEPIFVFRKKP